MITGSVNLLDIERKYTQGHREATRGRQSVRTCHSGRCSPFLSVLVKVIMIRGKKNVCGCFKCKQHCTENRINTQTHKHNESSRWIQFHVKTTLMSWLLNSDIRAQICHRYKMDWAIDQILTNCVCMLVWLSVYKHWRPKSFWTFMPVTFLRYGSSMNVVCVHVCGCACVLQPLWFLQLWLDAGGPGCAGAVPSGCADGSEAVKSNGVLPQHHILGSK